MYTDNRSIILFATNHDSAREVEAYHSFSFATSNDIVIAYNYLDMDKKWFLWLLNLCNLSPEQFY